ncbi:MAG: TonB-dependent receptor plug domain-containing protein [Flavobacterium sp.]
MKNVQLISSVLTILFGIVANAQQQTKTDSATAKESRIIFKRIAPSESNPAKTLIIRDMSTIDPYQPLYVVDGKPMNSDDVKKINATEIESMAVLKGHVATSIYGSGAANGAVVIKTKTPAANLGK